jgi:AcrR family transcriptional regulator
MAHRRRSNYDARIVNRMDRHNAQVRGRVLHAWGELLSETGFEAATMAAVASRAGLARSSVYRHFPDKESLFFEYLEDRVNAFVAALRTEVADEPDATARLRRVVVSELYRFADAPDLALSDVPEALSRKGRERLLACFQPLRALVRDVLEQGRREGTMAAVPIEQAIDVVFACVDVFRVRLARQWIEPDAIADDVADFVLRGLGAETGARGGAARSNGTGQQSGHPRPSAVAR